MLRRGSGRTGRTSTSRTTKPEHDKTALTPKVRAIQYREFRACLATTPLAAPRPATPDPAMPSCSLPEPGGFRDGRLTRERSQRRSARRANSRRRASMTNSVIFCPSALAWVAHSSHRPPTRTARMRSYWPYLVGGRPTFLFLFTEKMYHKKSAQGTCVVADP
jgi:hypothetical protein